MDQSAIHFDMVARRRLRAKIRAGLAVYCYPSGSDQLIAMAARTDAGRGEEAIEAHVSK